jgi:hypothetical protein
MIDDISTTKIESKLSLYERHLIGRVGGMTMTVILASVMIALAQALLINANEMRKFNNREDRNGL